MMPIQCGYCTPGQIMAVEGLLRLNPTPSMEEIRHGVSGNLCRCGTYAHIFKAAQRAAELRKTLRRRTMREERETPKPWEKTEVIGKPLPRVDAYERVSGSAIYPSDISLPDMLYGAILRCPHAHAKVLDIDSREAEKMPGVRAVIKGATNESNPDWPYLRGFKTKLFDPHCRHEGEEVAAVAAETPYQAWDAVKAIKVKYEILPFVADERKALESGAPAIHEGGNRSGEPQIYERGNVEKGFAEADVVLEETYRTESELHTPMELHGCVAKWDGDRLTVWESTQGVYAVQARVAEVLGLPLANVRVIGSYMGGGFGSKLQAGKYTIIAALLAKKTGSARQGFPHSGGNISLCRQPATEQYDIESRRQKRRDAHGPRIQLHRYGRSLPCRRNVSGRLACS